MFSQSIPLIIQKYGGATLSTPEKIKVAANNISTLVKSGHRVVVVVSAMGKTTNDLITLAHQVSPNPVQRELDMLLTVGERISMALMSIALNEIGIPSISLTGSQAGILTDEAHQNAFIKYVKPIRIIEALDNNQVVVLAGFQGVSPSSKEITTLGRGGTDTTAVAMAAALHADRCEILKDVSAVYSADPNIVKSAHSITELSYKQLLDMTFWGAKVLQYRSVELARRKNVTLYVGPARTGNQHNPENTGTLISNLKVDSANQIAKAEVNKQKILDTQNNMNKQMNMGTKQTMDRKNIMVNESIMAKQNIMDTKNIYESSQILSINSHERVLLIKSKNFDPAKGLIQFKNFLVAHEVAFPQILEIDGTQNFQVYLTGPAEILTAIENLLLEKKNTSNEFSSDSKIYSTVTVTSTGSTSPEVTVTLLNALSKNSIIPLRCWLGAMSTTVLVLQNQRQAAIESLHQLLEIDLKR